MDRTFATNFQRARRLVLAFDLVFVTAALTGVADVYSLEHLHPPGAVATYGFAVIFAVVMGCFPVLSYVLGRCTRRWGVERCPACRGTLWDNFFATIEPTLLQRCPNCHRSLRYSGGFDVLPSAPAEAKTDDEPPDTAGR